MEIDAPQTKTSGMAVTSLVLGISSIVLCCCGLLGVPAVILGHLARGRIKASGGALTGGGIALGGLIAGYLSTLLMFVSLASTMSHWPQVGGMVRTAIPAAQIQAAARKAALWPVEAGSATGAAYVQTLVEKGGLPQEQAASLDLARIQIGNVSEADPGTTIVARSLPGALSDGVVIAFLKNGAFEIYATEAEAHEDTPSRDPEFLAP